MSLPDPLKPSMLAFFILSYSQGVPNRKKQNTKEQKHNYLVFTYRSDIYVTLGILTRTPKIFLIDIKHVLRSYQVNNFYS